MDSAALPGRVLPYQRGLRQDWLPGRDSCFHAERYFVKTCHGEYPHTNVWGVWVNGEH